MFSSCLLNLYLLQSLAGIVGQDRLFSHPSPNEMKKYEITEQEEQIIIRCFSQSSNTLLKFFLKNLSLRISVRVASTFSP